MKQIIVVGSLNADLVQPVARVPQPGETILGQDLQLIAGGKGANQACAAGRLAGEACMVGNVGTDSFADLLIESLGSASVDTRYIQRVEGATGTACILVLPHGENLIVVSPAANGRLSPDQVRDRLGQALSESSAGALVLCQLEVPLETTQAALETARRWNATTLLDPAPAQPLTPALLSLVDFLTPNQTEAALLLHRAEPIETVPQAMDAARSLLALGPQTVIVKLGSLGCVIASPDSCEHIPGFSVEVRDTTAAGDTFNGAFAAGLHEGLALRDAVRFAHAASALSVSRLGAQSSIPSRHETDVFLQSRSSSC